MPRKDTSKYIQDPLERYRKRIEREKLEAFHELAEKEDSYDWRKRPSKPESRTKKLVRKLGTTGQIISKSATTGDDRTKYRTRNGVTWRVTKTEEELQIEAEKEAEREALRKKRSYEHRNDKGRPAYTRYLIKLNLVGNPKSYYYCGDELGWGTYECAVQYLGKKKTLNFAKRMIKNMGLDNNTERFDSIEVVSIPKELNKEWLYSENLKGIMGKGYEEENEYEVHKEYIKEKKKQNDNRPDGDCSNCLCNDCIMRDPLDPLYCDNCRKCKKEDGYQSWTDECERYRKGNYNRKRKLL